MKTKPKREPETNRSLRRLMKEHKLTRPMVKEFCRCGSLSTVDRWLVPYKKGDNPSWRRMPESKMELLAIRVQQAGKKTDNGGLTS